MKYNFRIATIADYEAILELKIQVHDFHVVNRPDFFSDTDNPFDKSIFEELLEFPEIQVFVIEYKNRIYGYAVTKILKFKNNPIINDQLRFFIEDICIDINFRKKGIGSILMKELESICKSEGYRCLELNVWAFNTSAIDFYKKFGMKTIMNRMEKIIN